MCYPSSMRENPVQMMVRKTGMSRTEFSVKHGFGKNLLNRLVQGRLQSVTPRIANALWSEWQERGIDQDEFDGEFHTLDVDLAYQNWVKNQRISNRTRLPESVKNNTKITPFARIVRAIGSISKTAQTLVVADAVVQKYSEGRQAAMPTAIRDALEDMRYSHVDDLDKAQKKWIQNNA